jgi:multidrug efflux pump subunit AcrA (membrane-fusion protein)
MWIRNPGKNKGAACLAVVVTLIWMTMGGQSAWGRDPGKAAVEGKKAEPAAVASKTPEVAFIGKFSCPVRRPVALPFQGIITSLQVQTGQKVAAGEVLAHYRLTPEAALLLGRRLSAPQVKDLEIKMAEVERNLSQAAAKRREIKELAAKKLASEEARIQADKNWRMLAQQKKVIQAQLRREKKLAADDLQALKEEMGNSLNSGNLAREAILKAPINGYVLFVNPNLREGAELAAKSVAFIVGVMDPLIVKAQVHEMESRLVKVGDLAEIQPESMPGKKFEARVSRLSWLPLKAGLEQPTYYEAEFEVPNPDLTLKDGMKVRIVLRQPR